MKYRTKLNFLLIIYILVTILAEAGGRFGYSIPTNVINEFNQMIAPTPIDFIDIIKLIYLLVLLALYIVSIIGLFFKPNVFRFIFLGVSLLVTAYEFTVPWCYYNGIEYSFSSFGDIFVGAILYMLFFDRSIKSIKVKRL